MPRLSTLLFAFALLHPSSASAQSGPCPADTILGKEFQTASASYATPVVISREWGSYQLATGHLLGHMESVVDYQKSVVIARDEYTITGVPAGSPVEFDLVLDVSATVSNSAIYIANVRRDGGAVASFSGGSDRSGSALLHLTEFANQPFELRYAIILGIGSIGSFSEVECQASFHFANLPAGSVITSCQGYEQSASPAIAASWGAVKASYR